MSLESTNWTRRLVKNPSGATNRASARSRTRVMKAISISPLVLAWRIEVCSPMARAASGAARNVVSAVATLAGLTSTAIRAAFGTSSCRSPSRLATSSWTKKLMPVALPPGRLKLATRPSLTGSSPMPKTIGIVVGRSFCGKRSGVLPGVAITATRRWTKSAMSAGRRSYWPSSPVVFHRHVLAFDITGFVEALAERTSNAPRVLGRAAVDEPDHRHRRLLRPRRQRPRRRAAEQRDELAPPHSITSSARPRSDSGKLRPSALAVLRLTISSTLVDCCTGRSAGFSPLRTRPV